MLHNLIPHSHEMSDDLGTSVNLPKKNDNNSFLASFLNSDPGEGHLESVAEAKIESICYYSSFNPTNLFPLQKITWNSTFLPYSQVNLNKKHLGALTLNFFLNDYKFRGPPH